MASSAGYVTPPSSPGKVPPPPPPAPVTAGVGLLSSQQFELDTKSVAKLTVFSGKDKDYPEWEFTSGGFFGLLGWDTAMALALTEPVPKLETMAEVYMKISKQLFHVLQLYVKGKALGILKQVERGNGLQAWKAMKEEYEPKVAGEGAGAGAGGAEAGPGIEIETKT